MSVDLDDITTANPQLVAAFQKYTIRVRADENFSFWFDKGNNEGKYHKYIKKGAPKELTLDNSALVSKFDKAAEKGAYSAMGPLFVQARDEVRKMLAGRMNDFEKSNEYKAYIAVKKAGNISKALKMMGLTGSNAKAMEILLKAYAVGNTSEKATAMAKMQKLAKAEQIKLALKNSGLI